MKIQLKNWKIVDVDLKSVEQNSNDKNSFDLSTEHFFAEEKPNEFSIGFEIKIVDVEFNLSLEAIFFFRLNKKITEAFKISDFPKINAPAIAFPYLRAYISNLTLQSGYKPVILPSINFIRFANKET